MVKIDLITLGKLKEKYWKESITEYQKRLSLYAQVNVIELSPIQLSESPSNIEIEKALLKEASLIQNKFVESSFKIGLCIEGEMLTSEEFSKLFAKQMGTGSSHFQFVIGSSHGIDKKLKQTFDYKLSFSKMTFPHQMMRVLLLEQVYRSFSILHNGKYHK